MRILKLLMAIGIIVTMSFADVVVDATNFPDANFRALIQARGWLTGDKITSSQLSSITYLNISYSNIYNIKGVELFTSATRIDVSGNPIYGTIDLSGNNNYIDAFIIQYCDNVTSVKASNTYIDTLVITPNQKLLSVEATNNPRMKRLLSYSNESQVSLDGSNNPQLVDLIATNNNLNYLNISNLPKLERLVVDNNKLTSLDVSKCTVLKTLITQDNNLTELILPNPLNFDSFHTAGNRLTSLNLGNNPAIAHTSQGGQKPTISLYKNGAEWISADIAIENLYNVVGDGITYENGKIKSTNSSTDTARFGGATWTGTADVYYPGAGTGFGGTMKFVYLNPGEVAITPEEFPDPTFREYIEDELDGNGDGILSAAEIALVEKLDLDYNSWNNSYIITTPITNLKGIKYFTNLKWLSVNDNLLTNLDLSKNTLLKYLSATNNKFESLAFKENILLDTLRITVKTSVDVEANTALKYLSATGDFPSIDLKKNAALTYVAIGSTQIMSLDMSGNPELTHFWPMFNPKLSSINVTQNTKLKGMYADGNNLTTIDLSGNPNLDSLWLSQNKFTTIDVSKNTKLKTLWFLFGNVKEVIGLDKLTELETLTADGNKIKTIDLSANKKLAKLHIGNNQLKELDLTANTELTHLFIYGNQLSYVDLSKATKLTGFSGQDQVVRVFLDNDGVNVPNAEINLNSPVFTSTIGGSITYDGTKISTWANKTNFEVATGYAGGKLSGVMNFSFVKDGDIIINEINFPDDNFRNWLLDANNINGYGQDAVLTKGEITNIDAMDLSGVAIGDMKGLEYFTFLKDLRVANGGNTFAELDLSNNPKLEVLVCGNSQTLTSINVTKNIALTSLAINYTGITSLDLSKNTNLTYLEVCANFFLPSLDISNSKLLFQAIVNNNKVLTKLVVGTNNFLTYLRAVSNSLTDIDLSGVDLTGNFSHAWGWPGLYGNDQKRTIILIDNGDGTFSSADISLKNPQFVAGLTYANNKITSNSKSITETPFKVDAQQKVRLDSLTGTLFFEYHTPGVDCEYNKTGDVATPATCLAAAEHKVVCNACGKENGETKTVGEPLGHDFSALGTVIIEGDCKTDPTTPTICKAKCSRCEVESADEVKTAPCDWKKPIEPCVHDFSVAGTVVTPGNCDTDTKTICKAKCSKCGIESETLKLDRPCDYVDPKTCEHNFSRTLFMGATCTTAPIYKEVCSVCNTVKYVFDGVALGHDLTKSGAWVMKPDCESGDYGIFRARCGRDGCIFESDVEVVEGNADVCDPAIRCQTCYRVIADCVCGNAGEPRKPADDRYCMCCYSLLTQCTCEGGACTIIGDDRYCQCCKYLVDYCTCENGPCLTTPIKPTPVDSKYGIKLAKNIVSDNAVINVIASEKVIETKVVVYDAIGNIVFATKVNGNEKITWDLRNNSGRFVANGGYLVIAEVKGISGKTYPFSAKLGVKR